MTPQEIVTAIKTLEQKVGPKSQVYVSLRSRGLSASLYSKGICQDHGDVSAFQVDANGSDFAEILTALEANWLAAKVERNERIIEKMALEIIRLTAEFGQCTDAALRAEFGPDVADLSDLATARANEMAQNGPFEVVVMRSANAA